MLLYKSRSMKIAEAWFDEKVDDVEADIIRYRQAPHEIPSAHCTPFYTLLKDLRGDEELIWNDIHSGYRKAIRRSKSKDNISCHFWDRKDPEILKQFQSFYNTFADQKRKEYFPWKRVLQFASEGLLCVSWVESENKEPIVYLSHIVVSGRARGLYGASHYRGSADNEFRQIVGRANRLLHWENMSRFKASGVHTYDFGGWYEGKEDQERLKINEFKERFGGKVVKEWHIEQLVSLKAKVLVPIARSFRRGCGK